MSVLEKMFNPAARGSTVRRELRAGLTSFMAMCYLIFAVPNMLADAGLPKDSAIAATIWITVIATLLMGLWAKFPVGVAPGLGITAFFAYYVCGPAGYTWQTGLGAVFISGVVFLLLTVTRVRQLIINAVPMVIH
jgi:Permeases